MNPAQAGAVTAKMNVSLWSWLLLFNPWIAGILLSAY